MICTLGALLQGWCLILEVWPCRFCCAKAKKGDIAQKRATYDTHGPAYDTESARQRILTTLRNKKAGHGCIQEGLPQARAPCTKQRVCVCIQHARACIDLEKPVCESSHICIPRNFTGPNQPCNSEAQINLAMFRCLPPNLRFDDKRRP